ncbi:hypothetical protein HDU86_003720 [Geranomyces michiganensis]|nr:hypothetical protein HDU86_003720 [Geranomyces michiganensis]
MKLLIPAVAAGLTLGLAVSAAPLAKCTPDRPLPPVYSTGGGGGGSGESTASVPTASTVTDVGTPTASPTGTDIATATATNEPVSSATSVSSTTATSSATSAVSTPTAHPGIYPKPTTNAPHSVRLAFAGSDGINIGFSSIAKFAGAPKIRYALKGKVPTTEVAGTSRTYPGTTSYFHYVTVKGLEPFTEYDYVIVGDSTYGGADSELFSFRTARAPGDHSPFTINMLGDMGLYEGLPTMAALTHNVMNEGPYTPEFDFQVGDISYADNNIAVPKLGTYEEIYDGFQRHMSNVTSRIPYMVFSGNHESRTPVAPDSPTSAVDFAAYRARFRMPSKECGANSDSMWYSFDYGMVHFVALDTETDIFDNAATGYGVPPGTHGNLIESMFNITSQKDWLAQDLAKVDRTKTPWVIVGGHRPFYTSRFHGLTEFILDQFEPLFQQFAVDLVLTGHNHFYERQYPVRNGAVTQYGYKNLGPRDPPIYIINGAAGNQEDHYAMTLPLKDFTVPTGYLDTDFGYAVMKFVNSTALEWTFVKTSKDGINSEPTPSGTAVFESFTIIRNHDNIPIGGFTDPLPFSAVKPLSTTSKADIAACLASPASHVCGDGFEQSAVFSLSSHPKIQVDAVIKINAFEDDATKALKGSFQLGYNDPETGKAIGIDSGKPLSINTNGKVHLVFAADGLKESTSPLTTACTGAAPTTLILDYDVQNIKAKNVSYTCGDSTVPVLFGAGVFSTFGTTVA